MWSKKNLCPAFEPVKYHSTFFPHDWSLNQKKKKKVFGGIDIL